MTKDSPPCDEYYLHVELPMGPTRILPDQSGTLGWDLVRVPEITHLPNKT